MHWNNLEGNSHFINWVIFWYLHEVTDGNHKKSSPDGQCLGWNSTLAAHIHPVSLLHEPVWSRTARSNVSYKVTAIRQRPHLAHMEVDKQKFPITQYFDIPAPSIYCYELQRTNSGTMLGFDCIPIKHTTNVVKWITPRYTGHNAQFKQYCPHSLPSSLPWNSCSERLCKFENFDPNTVSQSIQQPHNIVAQLQKEEPFFRRWHLIRKSKHFGTFQRPLRYNTIYTKACKWTIS